MKAFRKSDADISLCREWFTTRPEQSTIGLTAIVPMVIVRKGIVLWDIFAGRKIFRGRILRVGCIKYACHDCHVAVAISTRIV
jgi:hypothetical protein